MEIGDIQLLIFNDVSTVSSTAELDRFSEVLGICLFHAFKGSWSRIMHISSYYIHMCVCYFFP